MAGVVRKARPEDARRVFEMAGHFLANSSYGRWFPLNARMLAQTIKQTIEGGVIFLLEPRPGQVVGMLAAFPIQDPFSGQGIADEIAWWVEPEYRRGLAGTRLLRALESWARQKQLSLVTMVAPAESDGDVGRFYQRLGYTKAETKYVKRLD
jgi:GNAT superfamily N-acetyltransferase